MGSLKRAKEKTPPQRGKFGWCVHMKDATAIYHTAETGSKK
jgi:hypothetical protein